MIVMAQCANESTNGLGRLYWVWSGVLKGLGWEKSE